jgi:FKBP-type peptidyl-prolyl cis-trans isomerase FkpA
MIRELKIFFFNPIVLVILGCSTLVFSCAKSEYADFKKTESGLMYKFYSQSDDTTRARYGQFVRLKIVKRLGDSTIENSEVVSPDGMEEFLKKGAFKGAIEEGITMMAIGDSATFLINTDSINKYYPAKDAAKNFPPRTYLAFDLKLLNIRPKEEVIWDQELTRKAFVKERKEKEQKELDQYIQDNHIAVKPTSKGLYFIELQQGSGRQVQEGDSVVLHYTGSFLNGSVFGSSLKSNHPIGFIVGDKGPRGVMEGWYEGIKMMRKGGKASWIIPSPLAFDSAGMFNKQAGKYTIPPYSALKFDIQLLDLKSKK